MSTLIFGRGFVGKATAGILNCDIAWYDPAQGHDQVDLRAVDRAIICVPTPDSKDGLDHSAVYECLNYLASRGWAGPVAVRSTSMPAAFDSMLSINANLVYWPEFLREARAAADAANPTQVVLGGSNEIAHQWRIWLCGMQHAQSACWTLTDIKTAAMIKIGINSALAAKVMLFNSLYQACQTAGADWASVRAGVGLDPRIATGQTMVPGPDGYLGFGGKCLPKDLGALAAMLPDDRFLQGVIAQNAAVRNGIN